MKKKTNNKNQLDKKINEYINDQIINLINSYAY